MPALRGDAFLLKVSDGIGGFDTVAGLRGTSYSVDGESVNVTTKDDVSAAVLFRALLDGGGERSISISGDGVYLADATQQTLRSLAESGVLTDFQLDDGNEIIEGSFQVTNYEQAGPHNTEQTFSCTLESSGPWTTT